MPDPIVVDASGWLAVHLQEPGWEAIEQLWVTRSLVAPELIRYETANGILMAKRRGRFAPDGMAGMLRIVAQFPLQTIARETWWDTAIRLTREHALNFYDASYLAVAFTLNIPLLTLDREILKAMRDENVAQVQLS